jgi:hypothetical protein
VVQFEISPDPDSSKDSNLQIIVKGGTIADLCRSIEKIEIISINDESFSFMAYLKFANKEEAEMKFEPIIVDKWDIEFLPILQKFTAVRLPH